MSCPLYDGLVPRDVATQNTLTKSRNVNRYLSTCQLVVAGGEVGQVLVNQGSGLAEWEDIDFDDEVTMGTFGLFGDLADATTEWTFQGRLQTIGTDADPTSEVDRRSIAVYNHHTELDEIIVNATVVRPSNTPTDIGVVTMNVFGGDGAVIPGTATSANIGNISSIPTATPFLLRYTFDNPLPASTPFIVGFSMTGSANLAYWTFIILGFNGNI